MPTAAPSRRENRPEVVAEGVSALSCRGFSRQVVAKNLSLRGTHSPAECTGQRDMAKVPVVPGCESLFGNWTRNGRDTHLFVQDYTSFWPVDALRREAARGITKK